MFVDSIYNLIEDSGFESGISDNWVITGSVASFLRDSTRFNSGNWSAQIASPGTIGGVEYSLGLLPAGTYMIGAWIWSSNVAKIVQFKAGRTDFFPSGVGIVRFDSTGIGSTGQELTGSFTSDGIHPSKIQIVAAAGFSTDTFQIDDVYVVPISTPFNADTYGQMLPVADQDKALGFPLRNYLASAGAMFDQVDYYVRDRNDRPGWTVAVDPNTAPAEALDWLSQISGTVFPGTLSVTEKRKAIVDAEGRDRGTRRRIVREVQKYLATGSSPGDQTVMLFERTPDDDHFAVGVYRSQIPRSNEYLWYDWIDANPISGSAPGAIDGDFETGSASSWATSGGSLTSGATKAVSSEAYWSGLKSLKVTTTVSNQGVRNDLGVLASGTRTIVAFIKGTVGGERVNLAVEYNGGSTQSTQKTLSKDTWTAISLPVITLDGVNHCFISMSSSGSTDPHQSNINWFIDSIGAWSGSITLPSPSTIENQIWQAVERTRPIEFRQSRPVFFADGWTYAILGATYRTSIVSGSEQFFNNYSNVAESYATYTDLLNNNPI